MGLKLFYGTLTLLPHEAPELEGATFVERVRTAPRYRLFSLDDFPALLEQGDGGFHIDAEIWDVSETRWQELLLQEPPEYYVFPIELEDGRRVDGVTAPPELVTSRGVDVSSHRSWKEYVG